MSQRVTIAQAAKELGMAPQAVRERMKSGELDDIGYIHKSIAGKGDKKRYYIYRDMLDAHIGRIRQIQEEGDKKCSQEAATS